jgi:PAS domain S-box-containing protein
MRDIRFLKILALVAVLAAYATAFLLLYPTFGLLVMVLSAVPAIVIGRLFGLRGALVGGFLIVVLNNLLEVAYGAGVGNAFVDSLPGDAAVLLVGITIGWQSDLSRRLGQEVAERQQAQAAVAQLNVGLDERVHERTAELANVNQALQAELGERRRAEAALQKSEARLQTTMDSMLEGSQLIGFDWRYLYVNDAVVGQSRQSREDLLGHTMMEVYPGIEHTDLFAALQSCMEQRQPKRLENEFTYPDGSIGWFNLSIQPVAEGLFVLSHDITDSKRAELALQTAKEFAENIIQTANVIFLQLDVTGHVVKLNTAAEQISGYSQAEMVGRSWDVLVPHQLYAYAWEEFERITAGAELPGVFENPILTKQGHERTILWKNSVLHDGGQIAGTISFGIDITERKEAEAKSRQQIERLATLRKIDQAIMTSLDIQVTLQVILTEITDRLAVDAAMVLLFNQTTNLLTLGAARGLQTRATESIRIRLGQS